MIFSSPLPPGVNRLGILGAGKKGVSLSSDGRRATARPSLRVSDLHDSPSSWKGQAAQPALSLIHCDKSDFTKAREII
jgi:hypothetical protein